MKKIKLKYGFAAKLSLYFVIGIILVFIAVLTYDYYSTRKTIIRKNRELTIALLDSVINKIDIATMSIRKLSTGLVDAFNCVDLDSGELDKLLKLTTENNSEVYGCAIAFEPYMFDKNKYYYIPYYCKKDGRTVYYDLDQGGIFNYFDREWYKNAKATGKSGWSDPYYSKEGVNNRIITFYVPFYKKVNGEKKLYGVIACDMTLEWLMKYVTNIKIYNSGFAFILSDEGIFIEHKDENIIMNETIMSIAEKYKSPRLKKMAAKMLKGGRGFEIYYQNGNKYYITYSPLKTVGWTVGIVIPEDEMLREIRSLMLKIFILGLIGYILFLIVIIFLAKKLTDPLRNLADVTQKIGKGDFSNEIPKISSRDEIGLLSESFINMQSNLISYISNLKNVTAEKEKIEKELSLGREIQQSLLPKDFPEVKELDIFAGLWSAREVGGDLYDLFFIDEENICFAIGDVSGKGVAASLFMAITKTLIHSRQERTLNTGILMTEVNADLCKENQNSMMFVTLFIGIINIKTGDIRYCNAGHNPPIIAAAQRTYFINQNQIQPAIGFYQKHIYHENRLTLTEGDILFLYTDGVTEATNIENKLFSETKLLDNIIESKNLTVKQIVEKLKVEIDNFSAEVPQSDDITMLAFKYNGSNKHLK